MTINRTSQIAGFSVQGDDNNLNLRWRKLVGSSDDDSITINKKYIGGWGQVNLGSGTDSMTLAVEGDWRMLLLGVDSIVASQAATTLEVISDATFKTNGSFTSIVAAYGSQNITFTGAVRDSTITLGDSEDQVFFDATTTRWRYQNDGDNTIVYDLNSGYKVTLLGTTIENLNIENNTDPTEDVDVQTEDLDENDEGGTPIVANIPDDSESVSFGSTSVNFTPVFGGYAYGFGYASAVAKNTFTNTDFYYYYGPGGYGNFQYLPSTQLVAGTPATISFTGANARTGADALAERTANNTIFDGWLSVRFQDSSGDIAFNKGGVRLIMGSDNADTNGNIDQSTDSYTGLNNFTPFYMPRGDGGYAMYGFGGADSITGGANNDTIWGGTGADTIVGAVGNDRMFGEAGADVFAFTTTSSLATVVEGNGNDVGGDQVRDFTAADNDLVRVTLTSADTTWDIATHVLVGTATASTAIGAAASYSATTYLVQAGDHTSTADGFDIAVNITSNGSATNAGTTAAFANAAAAQAATMVNLTGTAGADTLTVGVNADTVLGMGGNDVINGAGGADSLDGGAGDDSFTFANIAELTSAATVIGGDDSDTITVTAQITAAVNLGTEANIDTVESLVLTGGSTAAVTLDTAMTSVTLGAAGSVVLTAAGQDVTGSTGADNVNTGSLTSFAGTTLSLGVDTDILTVATNNTNLSGINEGLATTAETLVISAFANTTMTAAQHAGFTTITATGTAGTAETVTISGNGGVTTATAVETYTIGDDSTNARTVTVSAAGTSVTATSATDAVTFNLGALTYTGTVTGEGAVDDILSLANGANISGGTITAVEALTLADNASVTMTRAQHAAFTGTVTAAAAETIALTGDGAVTTLAAVETYTIGDDSTNARTVTVSAAGTSVTATSATDAVTFNLGALTYTGTVTGEGAVDDILSLANGANISGGTITAVEALTLADNASVTMTRAQHAAFTGTVTAAAAETIALTGDGAVTTLAAVETYTIGDDSTNARTVTVSAAGTSVTATSATDAVTFNLGALTYTGTVTGEGAVDDILSLANGANISGGTITAVEALTLADNASVTMTRAQHAAFTGTVTAAAAETIALTGDGAVTTLAAVETYTIGDDSTNARTVTVSAAGTSVTATSATDAVTFNLGALTYTGTVTGEGAVDDILSLANGANISGGTITAVEALTLADNASVTMTRAQHAAFTGTVTAAAAETIALTGDGAVTTLAAVETYTIGDDSTNARTVTVSAAGTSVTATSATDAVTFNLGALTYTGTVTGEGAVDDILSLANGANISGGTITAVEALTLADNASVTMTRAQHAAFTGTVTAAAAETIALTGDGAVTTLAAVETYTIGDDSTNARTVTVSAAGTSVTATSATDAVTFNLGALTYTGTVTGEGAVDDILSLANGANISGGTITAVEALTLADNASVTMTRAQHAAFTGTVTAAAAETIALTGDGAVTTLAAVETYTIGDDSTNARTVTVSAAGTSVTATSATDAVTFNLGALTYTGTVTGEGAVDDILSLANGANISGGTITAVEALTLADNASVTMTRAQHAAFTGTVTAAAAETIALTGDGAVTTLAAVETYTIGDDSTNARTVTVSAAGTSVTATSATDAVTFNLGALTYTGTVTGEGAVDDILSLANGANISGGTITAVEALTLADNASVTMTRAQHAAFTGTVTAAAAETIALTGDGAVTTLAAVETYTIGDDSTNARTVTVSAAGTSVTATSATDAVTFNLGALTYTGTVTGEGAVDDILSLANGANISGGTITAVEALTLADNASVTMTRAQHAAFTGTVTAAAAETIALTGDGAVTTLAAVETYTIGDDSTNARTVTVSAAGTSVTATSATDAVTFNLGALTYTGTVTGEGAVDDILSLANGANISGGTITAVEALTLADNASVTMSFAQYSIFTAGITADANETIALTSAMTGAAVMDAAVETFVLATSANSVTTGIAGQVVNADALLDSEELTLAGAHDVTVMLVAGDLTSTSSGNLTVIATTGSNIITTGAGDDTINGGAGADNITLGTGNDTLVFNSLVGADTIADYVVADDSIQLSIATFTGLGAIGALAAAEFESGAGLTAAATAAGRIVYDTTAGNLYYDADGTGGAAAFLIGTFTGAPVLVVGEFSIIA